jgi:hypothetical protein
MSGQSDDDGLLPEARRGSGSIRFPPQDHSISIREAEYAVAVRQTEALEVLSRGVAEIANFLVGGGFNQLVSGYAKSQASTAILGGLASHAGRNALDARVLGQNALEVVEQVLRVHDKFHERLSSKEKRDPEIKPAVEDYERKGE